MSKTNIVPKVAAGGFHEDLGSALDVTIIPVPGRPGPDRRDTGAVPVAVEIFFTDIDGEPIEGRVGFDAKEDTGLTSISDDDDTLGYHKRDRQDAYRLPLWAKFLYVSSAEANGIAKGAWLYE